MRHWFGVVACLWLVACATAPPIERPAGLLDDSLFAAPTERISAADVFALSAEMKHYLASDIASGLRVKGRQQGLIDAMQTRGQLKLEYDTALTRNAAQAFEARAGNCLSLVIMTAALAKELGLRVRYQSALTDEVWSHSGNLYLRSGHVNLSLESRLVDTGTRYPLSPTTIDFLPASEIAGLRTQAITEATVVAMYMNNRAAETLTQGRLDDAYAWARESITQDPGFLSAYNTLGVVYTRHGDLAQAEAAFRFVLAHAPTHTLALANLANTEDRLGHETEAAELRRQLARIDPTPPFHFFELGMQAMQRQDFRAARELFAKEVARADYSPEFHYWLALANLRLGDADQAAKHLALAIENSPGHAERELYAAKLAWLRARQHVPAQ